MRVAETVAGNARVQVQVRMTQAGVEWLDEVAGKCQVTRSDVVRACIRVAQGSPELSAELKKLGVA